MLQEEYKSNLRIIYKKGFKNQMIQDTIQSKSAFANFKMAFSKFRDKLSEQDLEKKIEISFESEDSVEFYEENEIPTNFLIIDEKLNSPKKITANVFIGDKLIIRNLIKNQVEVEDKKESRSIENQGQELSSFLTQFSKIQEEYRKIDELKRQMDKDGFTRELELVKKIYDQRDELSKEYNKKEIELKMRELEINSEKKSRLSETLAVTGTEIVKGLVDYVKEDPLQFIELVRAFRAREI